MNISETISWKGLKVTYTWIETTEIEKYEPIRNVSGICVNDKGEALICREPEEEAWKIPGGRPEKGENPIQTLKRELLEEVDVEVDQIKAIGTQQVDFPNNPKAAEGELFYQVRYFGKITKLLPPTVDPDTGVQYLRKFVPLDQLNDYLKWGKIGEMIVKKAKVFFEEQNR